MPRWVPLTPQSVSFRFFAPSVFRYSLPNTYSALGDNLQPIQCALCPSQNFAGKNWCITNERHIKGGALIRPFSGGVEIPCAKNAYLDTPHAKRKPVANALHNLGNTYQPVVFVLDVPSIGNTKKRRGITYQMTYQSVDR